jgi:LmbE family N-acetylglucosaminyl deacetylase
MKITKCARWAYWFAIVLLLAIIVPVSAADANSQSDGKLRIIVFGAHPDDCEYDAGGTAALWAKKGHYVKFVSTTNGDVGHATMAGGPLAKRRMAEAKKADAVLGVESQVLDTHDGELMPTLENRKTIIRLIREWKADIVIAPRPYDYHPDHRYTGILVQDAAFMVTVPHLCPDVPQLAKNPVFFYSSDGFRKPNAFEPDIVVAIDSVIDQKAEALWQMESQVESLWATRDFEKVVPVPKEGEARKQYEKQAKERITSRDIATADKYRGKLTEAYGEEKGKAVKYAEAFELCEYGRQPAPGELKKLFPASQIVSAQE